jgi:hypothetical protein
MTIPISHGADTAKADGEDVKPNGSARGATYDSSVTGKEGLSHGV